MPLLKTLCSPAELAAHLDDKQWIIFDCRFDLGDVEWGKKAYTVDHIQGAHFADLDEDLSSSITPGSGRHPLPDPQLLAEKLGRWGVNQDTQVIVYDGGMGALAARMWWLLRWLGHEGVALLEGGYAAWQSANLPVNNDVSTVSPTEFPLALNNDLLVTADFVDRVRLEDDYCVVDARAPERFRGEVEPLDKVAGHIPGSINMPWENNLTTDNCFRSQEELHALFSKQLGKVSPQHTVHSCGSGVTACHNLLAMELAGLHGSKLYAGSWSAWITDPTRAVEKSM